MRLIHDIILLLWCIAKLCALIAALLIVELLAGGSDAS